MNDVRIIVTGGTIDKVHDPMTEGLAFAKDQSTHIPEILSIGRCHFPRVERIMLKDSLDFDDADRDAIVAAVSASEEACLRPKPPHRLEFQDPQLQEVERPCNKKPQ